MSKLFNRARMTVASTGTGTLTLGSAASGGFQSFAQAGVANGDTVSYVIEDTGGIFEYGTGTYTTTGTTLSRTVIKSFDGTIYGTTAISVTSSAIVYLTALAADILNPANNLSDLQSASTAKTNLSLNNVENTALSTWAGGSNITTLGTVATGTWSATAIALTKGGTGATDAATARSNLGLAIGSNVQAYDGDLDAIAALAGTSGLLKKAANTWSLDTSTYLTSAVTSVTGTSPVSSSGGATPAISLATGYGDTLNPFASKTANYILAAPNGAAGAPTFRALVGADIPTLNQNTTGTAAGISGTQTANYVLAAPNGSTGTAAFRALVAADIPALSYIATSATAFNKVTLTAPATSSTLTILDGKTLTANNSLTLAGTDSTTMTFPSASDTVVGAAATQTLTNKWIQPRILASTANSATPTLNTDNYDMMVITGQTLAITSFTTNLTGTPVNGQKLWIAITGTGAIAITWGAKFAASGTVTLPTTTVSSTRLDVGFIWNVTASAWMCVAVA